MFLHFLFYIDQVRTVLNIKTSLKAFPKFRFGNLVKSGFLLVQQDYATKNQTNRHAAMIRPQIKKIFNPVSDGGLWYPHCWWEAKMPYPLYMWE